MNLSIILIQSNFRKYYFRNNYLKYKKKIILLQNFLKKIYYRKYYLKIKEYVKLIQIKFRQYKFKNRSLIKECIKVIKENIDNYNFDQLDIYLLNDCKLFYDEGIKNFSDLKFTNQTYQKILIIKILQFFCNLKITCKLPRTVVRIIFLGNYFSGKNYGFIEYSRLDKILLKNIDGKYNYNLNIYLNNKYFLKILKKQILEINYIFDKSTNPLISKIIKYFKILKFVINLNYKKIYSLIKIQRWWIYNIKLKIILKYRNFKILKYIKKIQSVVRKFIVKYYLENIKFIKFNFPFKIKKFEYQCVVNNEIKVLWYKKNTNRQNYTFYKGSIVDKNSNIHLIKYDDKDEKMYQLNSKTSYIFKDYKVLYFTTMNFNLNTNLNLNKVSNNPLYLIGKKILIQNEFYLILNFSFETMIYLAMKYPLKKKWYSSLNIINDKIIFKIIKNIFNIFYEEL